jgi:hypothetical protein
MILRLVFRNSTHVKSPLILPRNLLPLFNFIPKFMHKICLLSMTVLILSACGPAAVPKIDSLATEAIDSSRPHSDSVTHGEIQLESAALTDSLGEYTAYNLSLSIETDTGTLFGYTSISAYTLSRDSLQYPAHIKRALSTGLGSPDTLFYWKDRWALDFPFCDTCGILKQKRGRIYYHLDSAALPMIQIRNIKLRSIFIDPSYFEGIASSLTRKDSIWINTPPIACETFGGYLCSYTIYIYQRSKILDRLIRQLRQKLSKYNDINRENGDELDDLLNREIKKFDGLKKVVVTGACTC